MTKIQLETKDIRISIDKVNQQEIYSLLVGINESPGFNNFTENEILKYSDENKLISIRKKSKLIGITTTKRINNKWTELAVFFIFKKFRGKGFGKLLWTKTISYISNNNIFLVTSNPRVKRMAKEYGFIKNKFYCLPLIVIYHFIINRFNKRKICGFAKKLLKKQVKFNDFAFYIYKNK